MYYEVKVTLERHLLIMEFKIQHCLPQTHASFTRVKEEIDPIKIRANANFYCSNTHKKYIGTDIGRKHLTYYKNTTNFKFTLRRFENEIHFKFTHEQFYLEI